MYSISLESELKRKITAARKEKVRREFKEYTFKQSLNYIILDNDSNSIEITIYEDSFKVKSNEISDCLDISYKVIDIMEFTIAKDGFNLCMLTKEICNESNCDSSKELDNDASILFMSKLIKIDTTFKYIPLNCDLLINYDGENSCKINVMITTNKNILIEYAAILQEWSKCKEKFSLLEEISSEFLDSVGRTTKNLEGTANE